MKPRILAHGSTRLRTTARPQPLRNRPQRRHAGIRWLKVRPASLAPAHRVLEPGDLFFNESEQLKRPTPTGLTENELLSALNYLDQSGLQTFHGIGPHLARRIVAYRNQAHYFASLDELAEVKGVGSRRFHHWVGRAHLGRRYRLHDLMRHSRQTDILVNALQPWLQPAPGIAELVLTAPGEAPPVSHSGFPSRVFRIRRWALHLFIDPTTDHGRAAFILGNIPRILRSLLHERSLSPTD